MNNAQQFIKNLKNISWSKPSPGAILNGLGENKLIEISKKYKHDSEALWIGAFIADMFITEAIATGDIKKHIPMALEFAEKVLDDQKIFGEKREKIIELIKTHHGGDQKHIESKLFKNADCFKFLEPKGIFHIFSSYYNPRGTEEGFVKGMEYAIFKVHEKYSLIDLDSELKSEAKILFDRAMWIFERMGIEYSVPELYSKS